MIKFSMLLLAMLGIVFSASRKSALENFISKKQIKSSRITLLKDNVNEINRTWIEYQYYFKEDDDLSENGFNYLNISITRDAYFRAPNVDKDCGEQYSCYFQQILNILNNEEEYTYDNDTDETAINLIVSYDQELRKMHNPLHETLRSRYALIYKKQNKAKDIFVLTFAGTLWLCFLVVLLLLALCLRISTYYHSHIYKGPRLWTWVEITLWIIAAACQQGFSYTPSRATSRTFFLLGYITAYVLYTAFTAAITSGLVQQETKIANHVNHLNELFLMIDDGTNIGIGPQVVFEQYISSNKLHDKGYNLIILAKSNGEYKRNFWIPKGLPEFQQRVNQRIIKIGESGILKFLMKKSLINMVSSNAIDSYSSASLEHVKSAILLFLTGLTFSVVFLIIELGVYGYRHRVTEQT